MIYVYSRGAISLKTIYFLDIKPGHIGSMSFFLCDLSKELGPDFMVAFTQEPTPLLKNFFTENGCNYIVVPKESKQIYKTCLQYDKVLSGFFRFDLVLLTKLYLAGIQYIYVQHSSVLDDELFENQTYLKQKLKSLKYKIMFYLISKVICVSNFSVNHLGKFGISKKKLVCIYNGVSIERQSTQANHDLIQPSIELINQGKNRIKCIYIGSLELYKGVDIILEATSLVPNVDFYIAGDGSLKNQVIEAAHNTDNIYYLGIVQNFILLAKYFDFSIIPSRWSESFCYTAIESLYSNLPVIASTKGALAEILQNQDVVFLERLDAGALVDAITKMKNTVLNKKNMQPINMVLSLERQTQAYANLLRS